MDQDKSMPLSPLELKLELDHDQPSQPQDILLDLLENLATGSTSVEANINPNRSFCLLCNSPRTIAICPFNKNEITISDWKQSYTNSFCQLFNLEISGKLKHSLLESASFCGKCLQLVLDIDFVMGGIQAYEQKLASLKYEAETLLYAQLVKNEDEENHDLITPHVDDLEFDYENDMEMNQDSLESETNTNTEPPEDPSQAYSGPPEDDEDMFTNFSLEKYNNFLQNQFLPNLSPKNSKSSKRKYRPRIANSNKKLLNFEPHISSSSKFAKSGSGQTVSDVKNQFMDSDNNFLELEEEESEVEIKPGLLTIHTESGSKGTIKPKPKKKKSNQTTRKKLNSSKSQVFCLICNKSYNSQKCLEKHYLDRHRKKPPAKTRIDKIIKRMKSLPRAPTLLSIPGTGGEEAAQLEADPDPPTVPCLLCPKMWYTQASLRGHYKMGHFERDIKKVQLPQKILSLVKWIPKYSRKQRRFFGCNLKKLITYPCEQCGKSYYTPEKLKGHNQRLHSGVFEKPKCQTCGKIYQTPEQVAEHEELHKAITSNIWVCVFCPQETFDGSFQIQRDLIKHVLENHESEENIFRCPHCPRIVRTKDRLKNHISSVHETRNYICETCGFQAKAPNILQRHQNSVHSTETPFRCDEEGCGKTFKLQMLLYRHKLRHGPIKDEFTCKICSKGFKTKKDFDVHSVYHLDIRPFICEICSASFKAKKNLRNHQKIHELHQKNNSSSYKFHPRKPRLPKAPAPKVPQLVPTEPEAQEIAEAQFVPVATQAEAQSFDSFPNAANSEGSQLL